VPFGSELFKVADGAAGGAAQAGDLLRRATHRRPGHGFDENQRAAVGIQLNDAKGGRVLRDVSRENIKKPHGGPAVRARQGRSAHGGR
jgi:preprotein translocase subunit SecD